MTHESSSRTGEHPSVRKARCCCACQLVVDSMLTFISLLTLLDGGWYGILAGFAAISGCSTMLAKGCGNELMSLQLAIMLNWIAIAFSLVQIGKTLSSLLNVEEYYQTYDEQGQPTANLDGLRVLLAVLAVVWAMGVAMRIGVTVILARAKKVRLAASAQTTPNPYPNP